MNFDFVKNLTALNQVFDNCVESENLTKTCLRDRRLSLHKQGFH